MPERTALSEESANRRRYRRAVVVALLFLVLAWFSVPALTKLLHGMPEPYSEIEDHFKYGSVGSDTLRQGFPYWIWKVLPIMFQEHLPQSYKDRLPQNREPGYDAFGLIVERDGKGDPRYDRPVGFSKRRIGMLGLDMVGLNCAFCHASTLRTSEDDHDPKIILGMPANSVDVEAVFVFLFETAKDPKFTGDAVIQEIEKQGHPPMGFIERTMYRLLLVPLYRLEIGKLEQKLCFIKRLGSRECGTTSLATDAGPGRLDLWAPYKVLRFATWNRLDDLLPDWTPTMFDSIDLDVGLAPGLADFAPLWQLEKRMGRGFHWDGNTSSLHDYTAIAALGFNVIPRSLDLRGFNRIALWARTRRPPVRYRDNDMAPERFKENADLKRHGKELYSRHCAACHDPGGGQFGKVTPVADVGTDPDRVNAFTEELANKLKKVGTDYGWGFYDLRKTRGYSNLPLDGVWLRAPYLHNGSVPTLRDLLNATVKRPSAFCRGYDVYDWEKIGFADLPKADCKSQGFFWYVTAAPGNGNQGHLYGVDLKDEEKKSLIEFLKIL